MLSTHIQFNSRKMSALKKEKRIIFTTKKKINNLAIELLSDLAQNQTDYQMINYCLLGDHLVLF